MNELVSIVLPVYNGEKYLRESIDSVLGQTYKNLELIVVDDCSTDSTPEIVKEYAEKDSRVAYYRNPQNLKLPKSLNQGFRLSKGNYLTWTSDDNRYRKNAIEVLVNEIKANDCNFVFTAFCRIDENGNKVDEIIFDDNIAEMIPVRNVVGASFMYTRMVYESVGEYDENLFLTEDFDYWQRIYARFGAKYLSNMTYEYRMHDGALTETRKDEDFYRSLCKTLEKNRHLVDRFNLQQNYIFYSTLSNGKDVLGEHNPYRMKAKLYKILYFYPQVIRRKVLKLIS